jgi:hypothetical protein
MVRGKAWLGEVGSTGWRWRRSWGKGAEEETSWGKGAEEETPVQKLRLRSSY